MAFIISKLFWFLASPGNVFVLVLCGGAILSFTRWRRLGRWMVALAAVAAVVITVIPVGQWLLLPLENRFPAVPVPGGPGGRLDGIIVLGGGVSPYGLATRGQANLNEHGDRLFALADLAQRFPDATIIYTGGNGSVLDHSEREADAARWLMDRLGLDMNHIIFEREARNTFENVLYSKPLAKPGPNENWLLVTSAFHMPRAVGIFREQGWPVIPYPVDYMTDGRFHLLMPPDFVGGFTLLSTGAKEWIGLAAYHVLGYADSLFPGPAPRRSTTGLPPDPGS